MGRGEDNILAIRELLLIWVQKVFVCVNLLIRNGL